MSTGANRPGQPRLGASLAARRRPLASAFTIVELLVVIVIVAALSAMVVPRFAGRIGAAGLETSAQRLLDTMRYARDFAVTHGRVCRLAIDTADGRFALEHQRDPEHAPDAFAAMQSSLGRPAKLADGVRFGQVRIDPDSRFRAEGRTVAFEPSGRAQGAVIALTDGERTIWLTVSPTSGRVRRGDGQDDRPPSDRQDLDA